MRVLVAHNSVNMQFCHSFNFSHSHGYEIKSHCVSWRVFFKENLCLVCKCIVAFASRLQKLVLINLVFFICYSAFTCVVGKEALCNNLSPSNIEDIHLAGSFRKNAARFSQHRVVVF